jgi:hypothetical protein
MSNKGKFTVIGENVNVAGVPRLYPMGFDGHTKHCLNFNCIANGGKGADGTEYKTTMAVKGWGPFALALAQILKVGSALVIEGRLSSFMKPTGQVVNGKSTYNNVISITATEVQVIGESKKALNELIAKNVAELVKTGVVRQEQMGILTGDTLLKHPDMVMVKEFNAATAMQSGKFGLADIWTKDRGNWSAKPNTVTSAAPAGVMGGIDPDMMAKLRAFMDAMTTTAAPAPVVDVVPTVEDVMEIPADTEVIVDGVALQAGLNASPVIEAFGQD